MLNLVRIWILLSTVLVSAGWILSALHQLNRAGYAAVLLITAVVFGWRWKKNPSENKFRREFHKLFRRFKKLPPFLFLLLACLTFIGGCLYPVNNWDANCYRLPRVFHWLWENQWHWIYTLDWRMNVLGCGCEWLCAPLILLTGNDRLVFLINWFPFLLLPGLIFSLFMQLQVRPRVAAWWMWLLPSGWCFALQAGSGANDSFAAVYALAAVDLALRVRRNGKISDLWLSMLAAALLSGVKQTNLPLVALWLFAAWPCRKLFLSKPISTFAVVGVAILISIVPVSCFNIAHNGNWLPLKSDETKIGNFQLNPFWGIVGNAFCIPAQNLWPPFSDWLPPFYNYGVIGWNEMMDHFLQTTFGKHFLSFERFGHLSMANSKGPSEENAGIGLGICFLIFVTFYEKWRMKKIPNQIAPVTPDLFLRRLRWMPWILLLIFMDKVGAYENARQLAPYYIFLFPSLLICPKQEWVVRLREWRQPAIAVIILAVLMVIMLPARPLYPVRSVMKFLDAHFPGNAMTASNGYFDSYDRKLELKRARLGALLSSLPSTEKI